MKSPSPSAMYRALVGRDPLYDGLFCFAVKTTGIFCRPTCPAKKPRAANVDYFPSAAEAQKAGYRPCKRCRPQEARVMTPAWLEGLMERIERDPTGRWTDADLIAQGVAPSRVRRYFREHYGMTFHAYHRSRRLGLALSEVRRGGGLLGVGLDHGFESASGFRDAFARLFGDPPGRARSTPCLFAGQVETPLGPMIAAANDDGLALLEFVDRRAIEAQVAALRRHFDAPIVPGSHPHLEAIATELASYFAGTLREFAVPLTSPASAFQAVVWEALKAIPYGHTASYAQIAAAIGRPGASRAVGRANGENRLAIVIPCHRVVRSDGHLCGYAAGLTRKQWLLDHERRVLGQDARDGWLFPAALPMMDDGSTSTGRAEVSS